VKRTVWSVAALLGLALLAGCGERKRDLPSDVDSAKKDGEAKDVTKKDGDDKDKKKTETPKHVPPKPLEAKEKTELTSVAYGEEYKKDPGVTIEKYKNKFLHLTGRVLWVGRSSTGEPLVRLEGAKGDELGVACFTRDRTPWLSALPGQTVKMQGKGPQVEGAGLFDCDALEVSGDPPPTMQADQLAAIYSKGAKAADEKYRGKPLIIEGEVQRVEPTEEFSPVIVVLKTKPGPKAYLRFETDSPASKRAAAFKPGQKVKVVGTYYSDNKNVIVGISYLPGLDLLILEPTP
jgi:hypothetical protein